MSISQIQGVNPYLVQIGYGSSSAVLNDRSVYPYFARVNPSDDEQAKAIVMLIEKLNEGESDINSAVILHSSTLYGRTAADVSKGWMARRIDRSSLSLSLRR